jgi:hypothetical protein
MADFSVYGAFITLWIGTCFFYLFRNNWWWTEEMSSKMYAPRTCQMFWHFDPAPGMDIIKIMDRSGDLWERTGKETWTNDMLGVHTWEWIALQAPLVEILPSTKGN